MKQFNLVNTVKEGKIGEKFPTLPIRCAFTFLHKKANEGEEGACYKLTPLFPKKDSKVIKPFLDGIKEVSGYEWNTTSNPLFNKYGQLRDGDAYEKIDEYPFYKGHLYCEVKNTKKRPLLLTSVGRDKPTSLLEIFENEDTGFTNYSDFILSTMYSGAWYSLIVIPEAYNYPKYKVKGIKFNLVAVCKVRDDEPFYRDKTGISDDSAVSMFSSVCGEISSESEALLEALPDLNDEKEDEGLGLSASKEVVVEAPKKTAKPVVKKEAVKKEDSEDELNDLLGM